jgi:hypothetical protein
MVIAHASAPADATTSISFRLLSTLAYLLPRAGLSKKSLPPRDGGVERTLLAAAELCNAEPFLEDLFRPAAFLACK